MFCRTADGGEQLSKTYEWSHGVRASMAMLAVLFIVGAPTAPFVCRSNNRQRRQDTHRNTGKNASATMCAAIENRNSRIRPLRVVALRSRKLTSTS